MDVFPAIHQLLDTWARRQPDSPAILAPGRPPLPYSLLRRQVLDTAGLLRRAGIASDDPVAVVLPGGPDLAVACLAIASAAIFAPLNPDYREREFRFYLEDLHAKALVVEEGSDSPAVAVARSLGLPILRLVFDPAGMFELRPQANSPLPSSEAAALATPDDIAVVLHTSGTTGRPKIVPLTHRNLCRSAFNISRSMALTPEDRSLNVMPLFHIHALVASVLAAIHAGGAVICPPAFLAPRFFDWVREFRPTWYSASPTIHQAVLERAKATPGALPARSLRRIRTGSVGLPAGPEVTVLGPDGRPVPPGSRGEIAIRGENVMSGYLRNPEANAASFTGGWFRTGDEGCFDSDGFLYLTGRLKEMINRGGEKVSPREIDEVLLLHPGVLHAVAFAVPHRQLGEEVGVAIVPRRPGSVSEHEIRQLAARELAHFKVPRVVKIVESIPKGPTGKLQRIGLAEALGISPLDDRRPAEREFVPPRDPLEEELALLWSQTLALRRAGVHDNFFFLGGDSVLATHLLLRVRSHLELDFPFVEFLEAPTIAAMAAVIRRLRGLPPESPHASGLIAIRPDGERPPLYCLPGHDGNLLSYGELARRLHPAQPMFGFPPACHRRRPALLLPGGPGGPLR